LRLELAIPLHHLSKVGIDAGLVSVTGRVQPRHHIGIQPDRYGGLLRTVESADDRIGWDLPNFGYVAESDFTIRFGSELLWLSEPSKR